MPRRIKLDETTRRRLLRLVMDGSTVADAARTVGCSVRTVERAAGRDALFGWRLRLARDARDAELRRQREAAAGMSLAEVGRRLCETLRRRWGMPAAGPNWPACDKTPN